MDELAAYFYQHVFLAYDRYRQVKNDQLMGNNNDRREAIDATVSLYHLREHVPPPYTQSRAQLAALCPDYDLLGDIVNATKHSVVTRGKPQVVSDDSISEVLVCTKFKDQDGDYVHEEKVVEVKLIDGSTRDMYEILTNVVNMWFDELHRIGAIDKHSLLTLPRKGLVLRKDASHVTLQLTQGIQWKQHFQFKQYNYEANKVEPIDLSDRRNLSFTIREPQTFEIQMGDESGLRMTRKIVFSPEQVRELNQIDGEEQQEQYLFGIAVRQGIVGQMVTGYLDSQSIGGKL